MYILIFLAEPKRHLCGCNLNKYELSSRSIDCYERKIKKDHGTTAAVIRVVIIGILCEKFTLSG